MGATGAPHQWFTARRARDKAVQEEALQWKRPPLRPVLWEASWWLEGGTNPLEQGQERGPGGWMGRQRYLVHLAGWAGPGELSLQVIRHTEGLRLSPGPREGSRAQDPPGVPRARTDRSLPCPSRTRTMEPTSPFGGVQRSLLLRPAGAGRWRAYLLPATGAGRGGAREEPRDTCEGGRPPSGLGGAQKPGEKGATNLERGATWGPGAESRAGRREAERAPRRPRKPERRPPIRGAASRATAGPGAAGHDPQLHLAAPSPAPR